MSQYSHKWNLDKMFSDMGISYDISELTTILKMWKIYFKMEIDEYLFSNGFRINFYTIR